MHDTLVSSLFVERDVSLFETKHHILHSALGTVRIERGGGKARTHLLWTRQKGGEREGCTRGAWDGKGIHTPPPPYTSLLLVFRMRWRSWLNSDKFGGKIHAICIGHRAGRDESVEAGQRHLRRTHQHAEGQG